MEPIFRRAPIFQTSDSFSNFPVLVMENSSILGSMILVYGVRSTNSSSVAIARDVLRSEPIVGVLQRDHLVLVVSVRFLSWITLCGIEF